MVAQGSHNGRIVVTQWSHSGRSVVAQWSHNANNHTNGLTFIIKFATPKMFFIEISTIPTCHTKFCPTSTFFTRILNCSSICSRIFWSNSFNTLSCCDSIWYPFIWWSWSSYPISFLTLGYKFRPLIEVWAALLKKWKYVSQSVDLQSQFTLPYFLI